MEQTSKELLLKDISARLPYGTLVYAQNADDWYDDEISTQVLSDAINEDYVVKPYLFPFSSMGPKEYVEFVDLGDETSNDCFVSFNFNQLDWLNAHHFDYRGLIEQGLAIDATGLNIY